MSLPRCVALFTLLAVTALQTANWHFGGDFFRRLTVPPLVGGPDAPRFLVFTPLMWVAVTLLVLVTGLYAIGPGKYRDSQKKWAYGAVGIIIGYWMG